MFAIVVAARVDAPFQQRGPMTMQTKIPVVSRKVEEFRNSCGLYHSNFYRIEAEGGCQSHSTLLDCESAAVAKKCSVSGERSLR